MGRTKSYLNVLKVYRTNEAGSVTTFYVLTKSDPGAHFLRTDKALLRKDIVYVAKAFDAPDQSSVHGWNAETTQKQTQSTCSANCLLKCADPCFCIKFSNRLVQSSALLDV